MRKRLMHKYAFDLEIKFHQLFVAPDNKLYLVAGILQRYFILVAGFG